MRMLKKLFNKLYTLYLNTLFTTVELKKGASIDYRCEIEQKNNISHRAKKYTV